LAEFNAMSFRVLEILNISAE